MSDIVTFTLEVAPNPAPDFPSWWVIATGIDGLCAWAGPDRPSAEWFRDHVEYLWNYAARLIWAENPGQLYDAAIAWKTPR